MSAGVEPRFQRLRVLRGGGAPQPDGHAHDKRHAALAAEHEAVFGGLVHHFVDGAQREINHAQLHHGAQACQGHAHACADDGGLRNGRVHDAFGAKAFCQRLAVRIVRIAVLAEHAAPAQVFAQGEDALIGLHGFSQRQRGGLRVGEGARLRHFQTPSPVLAIS